MAFGVSVSSHLYDVSVCGFDGEHSQHHKSNCAMLSIMGRNKTGKNVTLDTAFVNVKDKDNISWVFNHCMKAGNHLVHEVITCDREKTQDTVK